MTRPTGAAVRSGIEQQLAEVGARSLTVIDFSHVGLLDFSCADEIVAKLLLRQIGPGGRRDAYFVFRGLTDSHLEAVEAVLARHGLAIVAEAEDGTPSLVGELDEGERLAWAALTRLGRGAPPEVAAEAGLEPGLAASLLDTLWGRRVAMRLDDCYVALEIPTIQ
ncbi:MAG: hypothetical protein M3373_07755 [Gemmatimonadota bacterium]|nr:hypothetical protein [Gemmatimonadota bacterium]